MIDPRLAWFAAGATFGLVLCGWPWHPRFSRFSRRRPYSSAAIAFCATAEDAAKVSSQFINPAVGEPWPEPMTVEEWACRRGPRLDPGRVQRGNGSGGPTTPKPEIVPGFHGPRRTVRWFINNPVQIAECGGPCTVGPTHCDCGALWVDVPTTNQPPTDP